MPKQIPTIFTAYEFTTKEELESTVLSELQTKRLLTLRSEAATSKNNITLDPENISKYLQDEAYWRGQIDILSYMLEAHDASLEIMQSQQSDEN